MSLKIVLLLREGGRRTAARNGLLLVVVLFVLSALSSLLGAGVAEYTANQGFVSPDASASAMVAVPPLAAGVLSLVLAIATLVVSFAAIRVFVSDETERLPRDLFTRRMGWVALNAILGAIVFGIVVGIGFVLLVIPGLFLLVTLAFWTVFVAVEDENFVAGFRHSWGLTKGHRLRLFGLGIAVVLAAVVIELVFGLGMLAGPTIGGLVASVGSAIANVFVIATLAVTYTHLTALRDEDTRDVEAEPAPETSGRETV